MISRDKAVSRVVNELRSLNKDEYFSRRAILQMLEDKAVFLLSQKLGEKNLYRESALYSHIPCFELEKIDVVSCEHIEFRTCQTLMKSVEKLPEVVYSKYGAGILNVTSIDGLNSFSAISARDYTTFRKRKFAKVNNLIYIEKGGYIYIPNFEVYAVNLDILTLRVEEIAEKSCQKGDCCKSYWDYPLVNSDKFAENVMREVIQEALGTFRSIPIDEQPDKDSNIKSQKTV